MTGVCRDCCPETEPEGADEVAKALFGVLLGPRTAELEQVLASEHNFLQQHW